jgi:hypothetical protein
VTISTQHTRRRYSALHQHRLPYRCSSACMDRRGRALIRRTDDRFNQEDPDAR